MPLSHTAFKDVWVAHALDAEVRPDGRAATVWHDASDAWHDASDRHADDPDAPLMKLEAFLEAQKKDINSSSEDDDESEEEVEYDKFGNTSEKDRKTSGELSELQPSDDEDYGRDSKGNETEHDKFGNTAPKRIVGSLDCAVLKEALG